jgi:osmotically-inducible protein OsmY
MTRSDWTSVSRQFLSVCRYGVLAGMGVVVASVAVADPGALVDDARRSIEELSPSPGEHHIAIEYRGAGKIELQGDVASQEDKRRIVNRVEAVKGVKQVDDTKLVVAALGGSQGGSEDIRSEIERVREAIRTSPTRGTYSVVVVSQSLAAGREILRLQGNVESEQTRDDILNAARRATSLAVIDEMTLQKPRPDSDIQDDIQRTIREDYPAVASHVDVSVRDGVAYLRGDLTNHRDVDKVLAAANSVKGVRDIMSEITIRGRPYTKNPK